VQGRKGKEYEVVIADGRQLTVASDKLEPANTEDVAAFTDITEMTHLNEPAILSFCLDRFNVDQIYTYAGPVLIAFNPCKRLPDLFTEALRKDYQGKHFIFFRLHRSGLYNIQISQC
jgi:myosin heavy subunit